MENLMCNQISNHTHAHVGQIQLHWFETLVDELSKCHALLCDPLSPSVHNEAMR